MSATCAVNSTVLLSLTRCHCSLSSHRFQPFPVASITSCSHALISFYSFSASFPNRCIQILNILSGSVNVFISCATAECTWMREKYSSHSHRCVNDLRFRGIIESSLLSLGAESGSLQKPLRAVRSQRYIFSCTRKEEVVQPKDQKAFRDSHPATVPCGNLISSHMSQLAPWYNSTPGLHFSPNISSVREDGARSAKAKF